MLRLIAMVGLLALYTALAPGANPARAETPVAAAGAAQIEVAKAARGEAMKKLVFSEPRPVPAAQITDPSGAVISLADYRGRWLVVNFWAVWCVPCRVEMPALDQLSQSLDADQVQVLTVAAGRNPIQAVDRFFEETGVTALPKLLDPRMALSREMGVLGLPVTVIVDPDGNEIARLIGDADWNSGETRAVLAALTGG